MILSILNGFAFKSEQYVDDGIRIIRIANVQKGYIEDSTPVFYPLDSKDAKKYSLEEGDMLMSLTGNVGRVAEFHAKEKVSDIAKEHGRTYRAIESRLDHLGLKKKPFWLFRRK